MMQAPDNDNEFDDLIRAAGANYDAPGASPDWDKMNTLLDQHLPVKKERRRRPFILLFALLLLFGVTYLYFSTANLKPKKETRDSKKIQVPAATAQPSTQPAKADQGATGRQQPEARETNLPAIPIRPGSPGKGPEITQNEAGKQPSRPVRPTPGISQSQAHTTASREKAYAGKGHSLVKTKGAEAGENGYGGELPQSPAIEGKPTDADSPTELSSPANKNAAPPGQEIPGIEPDSSSAAKTGKPASAVADTATIKQDQARPPEKKKSPATPVRRPLEISLLYAPELTTVGFSHVDKPGSNYGILLGYRVSRNLVLQTGLIRSRKNYIANGEDFNLDYALPPNHKITKVDGYCIMYEVPLNLSSRIVSRKRYNVFYTAGLSSYFMKREYYTYYYVTNYGGYTKDVAYNSQKNYWFSLATLGLGVEKPVSPSLSVAAMPFVKIPFKGVGEGTMKLTGTGINFLLTYKPAFSAKK
jgi:hypothetical protein